MKLRPQFMWIIRERVWTMTSDVADVLLSLTHRLHIYSSSLLDNQRASMSYCLSHTAYTFTPHLYWTIRERVWTMTPDVADVLLSLTHRLHIYSSSLLDNQRASVDNDTDVADVLLSLTHRLHIYSSSLLDNQRASVDNDPDVQMSYCLSPLTFTSSLLDNQRASVDNDTRCGRCLTVSHTPLTHLLLISTGQSESECGQ
ncbi:hypothetical protein J6590_083089 [Homalodisca vitripennis]|nr:hypothetical protein J6590_083089 [Homalodisca vitripennis]